MIIMFDLHGFYVTISLGWTLGCSGFDSLYCDTFLLIFLMLAIDSARDNVEETSVSITIIL